MRERVNGRRIYALADYSVERTGKGWYFGRTSRSCAPRSTVLPSKKRRLSTSCRYFRSCRCALRTEATREWLAAAMRAFGERLYCRGIAGEGRHRSTPSTTS